MFGVLQTAAARTPSTVSPSSYVSTTSPASARKGEPDALATTGPQQAPSSVVREAFPQVDRVPPAGIEPATRGLGNPVSTSVEYDWSDVSAGNGTSPTSVGLRVRTLLATTWPQPYAADGCRKAESIRLVETPSSSA
jgi:hypothetical protein